MTIEPQTLQLSDLHLRLTQAQVQDAEKMYFAQRLVYQGYSPWSQSAFERELQRDDSLYVNVWSRSQLVGFIGAHFNGHEAHITNLAVIPTVQERGIGSYLLQLIIDRARDYQIHHLSLEVRIDNEPAQRLYRKFGFQPNFVRHNYYDDIKVDGLDMVLKLL
ncbi:MAG: ribosomal protein S18-alanine N-acetyltransferase [Lactobacillus sp.]|nr:ribosomal protein S18-alanine N-acetyltransferase [Lactobacillus sp.]MCI1330537.1 ribosomal protein S18-alanine N-acetyltransferase [Lactobacillus sp.]MCI1883928.1 ribosomal protein S18-alanine N-acetyltransferase [Lactobacillus sp.]